MSAEEDQKGDKSEGGVTHEQTEPERPRRRCTGRRGNNRILCRMCGGVVRGDGGDDGMNDVVSVILACASSAVAGGATGALIQAVKDDKIIDRKNRIIAKLRRQLADWDTPDKPSVTPTTNNDWMRETIQFPVQE